MDNSIAKNHKKANYLLTVSTHCPVEIFKLTIIKTLNIFGMTNIILTETSMLHFCHR